jgi:hypothetical protein
MPPKLVLNSVPKHDSVVKVAALKESCRYRLGGIPNNSDTGIIN